MFSLLLLAVGLAMDAFAVSISLGSKHKLHTLQLATLTFFYFGIAQGIMPLIGYLGGHSVFSLIEPYIGWISCFILVALGCKMIYESMSIEEAIEVIEKNSSVSISKLPLTHKAMFSLSLATSIDAIAAGFTFNLLPINAYIACIAIAIITGSLSFIGTYVGKLSGTWLESKAEIFGGLVLIAIGIKMVF